MNQDNDLIIKVGTKVDINGLLKQLEEVNAKIDVKTRSVDKYTKKQNSLVEGTEEYVKNSKSLANAKNTLSKLTNKKDGISAMIDAVNESQYAQAAAARAMAMKNNSEARIEAAKTVKSREERLAKGITTSSTTKLQKFANKFKNILLSRIIRSAINMFVKNLKEGVNNVYQWSKQNNGTFAKAMDSISSSFKYIINAGGAMIAPLLEAIEPLISKIADGFARATEAVSKFFAVISGGTWYYKATKSAVEYASAVGEVKNQLLGFDELNILTSNSSSSTSGLFGFEIVDVEDDLGGFLGVIKNVRDKVSELNGKFKELPSNIKTIAASLTACGLIGLLGLIVSKMADKNKVLKTQTGLTDGETSAVTRLSTVLGTQGLTSALGLAIAGLAAGGLVLGEFGKPLNEVNSKLGLTTSSLEVFGNTALLSTLSGATGMETLGDTTSNILDQMNLAIDNFVQTSLTKLYAWAEEAKRVFSEVESSETTNSNVQLPNSWTRLSAINIAAGAITTRPSGITSQTSTAQAVDGLGQQILNGVTKVAAFSITTAIENLKGKLVGAAGTSAILALLGAGGSLASVSTLLPGLFASGGIPAQGSMFIAGEAGPEYVASINGRTQVYNDDQLAGSFANANAGVINTLTAVGNSIVSAINRKDTSISANDVRSAISNMNMRYSR